jgi:thiamine kinase-like enzyme
MDTTKEDIVELDMNLSLEDLNKKAELIVKEYFCKQKISSSYYQIQKLDSGLSNHLFILSYKEQKTQDEMKYFLRIFGNLSTMGIDRKFEYFLIDINAKKGLCPKIIETDLQTYRLEELLPKFKTATDQELFTNEFLEKIEEIIINFQTSIYDYVTEHTEFFNINIFSFFRKIMPRVRQNFDNFMEKFNYYKNSSSYDPLFLGDIFKTENLNIISDLITDFDLSWSKIKLDNIDKEFLILSHNDVHKQNLLLINGEIMLIDYEYACFNFIGFDIINYCIESFFDLDKKQYPFFGMKVENVKCLFEDGKYYQIYLNYIDKLNLKFNLLNKLEIIRSEKYFIKIAAVCSLFWFFVSLLFLDFDSIFNKTGFNYIDYSIERLCIYNEAIKLL